MLLAGNSVHSKVCALYQARMDIMCAGDDPEQTRIG
jgi:hypothetical protein